MCPPISDLIISEEIPYSHRLIRIIRSDNKYTIEINHTLSSIGVLQWVVDIKVIYKRMVGDYNELPKAIKPTIMNIINIYDNLRIHAIISKGMLVSQTPMAGITKPTLYNKPLLFEL
jgi:hypothetical protein